jgi:hypothetical protein
MYLVHKGSVNQLWVNTAIHHWPSSSLSQSDSHSFHLDFNTVHVVILHTVHLIVAVPCKPNLLSLTDSCATFRTQVTVRRRSVEPVVETSIMEEMVTSFQLDAYKCVVFYADTTVFVFGDFHN